MKWEETERNRKKQEETGRNWKKREETRKKLEDPEKRKDTPFPVLSSHLKAIQAYSSIFQPI